MMKNGDEVEITVGRTKMSAILLETIGYGYLMKTKSGYCSVHRGLDAVVGISGELEKPIDVPELEEALQSTFGRDVALHINELAHGTLLRTAASA